MVQYRRGLAQLTCAASRHTLLPQVAGDYIAEVFWHGANIEVESVEVVKHGLPHTPTKACGLALVRVKAPADGLIALTKLDGHDVLGR